METQMKLKAYAKINLSLDVVGKRADGYHEVRMIMQMVDLYDTLTFQLLDEDKIVLTSNISSIPLDERNLVYKAIKLIKDTYHVEKGVEVDLQKNIPAEAGMAGGSTDCAAALIAASTLFGLDLEKATLMELGVKLGADVPYCVMGGTALSEGIGEVLTPLSDMPNCYILIAKPPVGVSTKFVYEHLDAKEDYPHPDVDGMVDAIHEGNLEGIASRMENVLELVTIPEHPVIEEIKNIMKDNGALNAMMSGSGPTVFGIYTKEEDAQKAYNVIESRDLCKDIHVVKPHNN